MKLEKPKNMISKKHNCRGIFQPMTRFQNIKIHQKGFVKNGYIPAVLIVHTFFLIQDIMEMSIEWEKARILFLKDENNELN